MPPDLLDLLNGADPTPKETQTAGAPDLPDMRGGRPAALPRRDIPDATVGSVARDIAAGALQIGPTAIKGMADIARLFTGDRVGKDTSETMERGMGAIRDAVGSERAAAQRENFQRDMADNEVGIGEALIRNKGALADQLLPTIGSMFIPVGVAGAAGKVATATRAAKALDAAALAARVAAAQKAAGVGATAAQNAASTFAELVDKGVPMQDAYVGAGITLPFSVVAGALTGGGAEVAAVRALTGTGAAKAGAKQLLKAPLKEGGQEMGEELGQIAGEGAATGEMPSAVGAGKQLAVAGTLGAAMGAGVDVATQAGQRTRAKAAPPDTEPQAEAPAAPRAVEPVPLPAGTPAAAMDQNTPLDSAQDAPAAAQPDIVASSTGPNPGQQADRGALAQRMEAQAELAAAGDVPASEAALPAAAGELDDVTGTPFQQRGDLVPDRAARTAAIEAQEAVERQAQSPERIAAEQTMPGKPGDADLAANERHDAAQIRRGATASKVEQAQAAPAVAAAAPAGTAPGSVTVQAKTFPQYQLERGFKPSGMRKGTPEWDTLLAEWAAITNARAGTNPEGSGSAGVPARESQNRGPSHPASGQPRAEPRQSHPVQGSSQPVREEPAGGRTGGAGMPMQQHGADRAGQATADAGGSGQGQDARDPGRQQDGQGDQGAGEDGRGEVTLRGDELGAWLTGRALREAAKEFARTHLADTTAHNLPTDQDIALPWQGLKHAISNANDPELRLIPALPELLKVASLKESLPDKAGRPDIVAAHRYAATARLGDETLDVGIVVREHRSGHRFYDHFIIGNKNPTGISEATTGANQQLGVQPAVGSGSILTQGEARRKELWSRAPVPADDAGAPSSLADPAAEKAGQQAAMDSSQSGINVSRQDDGAKYARAADDDFGVDAVQPAMDKGQSVAAEAVARVQAQVDAIRANWKNAPEVVVVATMQDAKVPQRVRDHDAEQKSQGATGEPEGFFYRGKVYIVAGQVSGPRDVARVLFHEALGHYGLRGVFGEALRPILQQIASMRAQEVRLKAEQYGLDWGLHADRLVAAEEVLAEMAEKSPQRGFVRRAVAAVRTFLRQNVPGFEKLRVSDAEIIRDYILPARGWVERGALPAPVAQQRGRRPELHPASSQGPWDSDENKVAAFAAARGQVPMFNRQGDAQSGQASGIPPGLPSRQTDDTQRLERRINSWLQANGRGQQPARFEAVSLPDDGDSALARFASATGTRVVVVRNLNPAAEDFNGVGFGDGVLYVNEAAQYPITLVAAHEWLHQLKRDNPPLYQHLENEVRRQGLLDLWHDRIRSEEGVDRGRDHAAEELTAAAVSDALTDPEFLARVARDDRSLFQRVARAFLEFLEGISGRVRDQGSDAYLQDVQAFRARLENVLRIYQAPRAEGDNDGDAAERFLRVWFAELDGGFDPSNPGIRYSFAGQDARTAAVGALQRAQVQADAITARWARKPDVQVVFDLSDPRVPEAVRSDAGAKRAQGADSEPAGVFHEGGIYLLASQLPTEAALRRVLFHEALGHYGLRGVFGEALTPILQQIATVRAAEVRRKADQYKLDWNKREDRLIAAEEVLAEMAEKSPQLGFVRRAVVAVRTFLRQNVPGFEKLHVSDAEIIRDYILPARAWVERGALSAPVVQQRGRRLGGQSAFSRGARGLDEDKARVLQGEPVAVLRLEDAPSGGYADVARWAAELFVRQGGRAISPEIGEVTLSEQSARDSLAHGGANAAKKIAFAAVKDVIERGALVYRSSHGRLDSFYISAPVDISGRSNIVTALVRRDPNMQRMYLHSVALKENLLKPSVSAVDARASERGSATTSGDGTTVPKLRDRGKASSLEVAQELQRLLTLDAGRPDTPMYSRGGSIGSPLLPTFYGAQPKLQGGARKLSDYSSISEANGASHREALRHKRVA